MMERIAVATIVFVGFYVPALYSQSCENLSKLASPTVTTTLAETISAGTFKPTDGKATIPDLPAFCRVAATLKPTPDSDILTEIWLPVSTSNGKFMAIGSGGWGGSINEQDLAEALRRVCPYPQIARYKGVGSINEASIFFCSTQP
jgi:feruloyl esterase